MSVGASEAHEHRLKRLKMRSMRRGIKEMDLILSAYAERHLQKMEVADLDLFERLLQEADQDLYQWITGQAPSPADYTAMIRDIAQTLQSKV